MWFIIIALLVWDLFLFFVLIGKDADYFGTVSSLKLEIERKNIQIEGLEKQIKHLENQDSYEPEV
jgi:hypothetical protein